MALLEPKQNIYLVKALFGILMLIPQSQAYDQLSKRLLPVTCIATLPEECDRKKEEKKIDPKEKGRLASEEEELVNIFMSTQRHLEEYYQSTTAEPQFQTTSKS